MTTTGAQYESIPHWHDGIELTLVFAGQARLPSVNLRGFCGAVTLCCRVAVKPISHSQS
jgi:hypothetical protein